MQGFPGSGPCLTRASIPPLRPASHGISRPASFAAVANDDEPPSLNFTPNYIILFLISLYFVVEFNKMHYIS